MILFFDELVLRVQACRVCPAMDGRRRVLSRANGNLCARLLFVAEAPGRLGGELTGIPLSRDRSGKRFEQMLGLAGLGRDDVFITNAALCNPRDESDRNRRPSAEELYNCGHWLKSTILVVNPDAVITLGATALSVLRRIDSHDLLLRRDVGLPVRWFGRWLYPLYHPSPRAGLSRSYAQQDDDMRALGSWFRALPAADRFDPPWSPS
jgi:uracil-DNA glycosylase family 4